MPLAHVMVVDDEPSVLRGLRRMLQPAEQNWTLAFCDSAPSALEQLDSRPVSVVVTDMRMPEMGGSEFLRQVWGRSPGTARIVLSGSMEDEVIAGGFAVIHRFLPKPCEPGRLRATLERLLASGRELTEEVRAQVAGQVSPPCSPSVLKAVRQALAGDPPDLEQIGQLLDNDIGLACSVLHLAYSGLFGDLQSALSCEDACRLVSGAALRRLMTDQVAVEQPDRERLASSAEHGRVVGALAFALAEAVGCDKESCRQLGLAGRLHNLGGLLLPEADDPTQHAGAAYFLSLRGFPDPVVEAVRGHGQTPEHQDLEPTALLYLADQLIHAGMAPEHAALGPFQLKQVERWIQSV